MAKDFEITDGKNLVVAEKKLKAYELKKAGWSYGDIGRYLGIKSSKVCEWVQKQLQEYREQCNESIEELIQIESERYDEIIKAFWYDAIEHKNFKAADVILRVFERKAKLLGLDAPEKQVRVSLESVENMSNEELAQQAKLLGLPMPQELLAGSSTVSSSSSSVIIKEDPSIPPLLITDSSSSSLSSSDNDTTKKE